MATDWDGYTSKDFSLIIYDKNEIDQQNTDEALRVDTELDLKSLKSDEGSPSGLATLDSNGPWQGLRQSGG